MKFYSALKIEGTEVYQVLTYFYTPIETMASALEDIRGLFDIKDHKVFQLYDVDWPIAVVLVEATFSTPEQAASAIVGLSLSVSHLHSVYGSMCMFDGAFSGYEETFSHFNTSQIYSVWTRNSDLNIAMNEALRESKEWQEVIADFKKTLGF